MKTAIKKLLVDYEKRHSDFQIEHFIIGNAGDQWAQYKQALRELETRYETLTESAKKIEFAKKRIEEAKNNKIKVNGAIRHCNRMIARANSTYAEFKKILSIAESLKQKIGVLTPEKRKLLERQSWANKALKLAAIDRFLTGSMSKQTFEFILALPVEDQEKVLESIMHDRDMKSIINKSRNPNVKLLE